MAGILNFKYTVIGCEISVEPNITGCAGLGQFGECNRVQRIIKGQVMKWKCIENVLDKFHKMLQKLAIKQP